jgi:hypothetical protein
MSTQPTKLYRAVIVFLLLACGGLIVTLSGSTQVAASPMLLNFTPSATVTGTPPTSTPSKTVTITRTPTNSRTATNTRPPTSTRTPLPTPLPCGGWRHVDSPDGVGSINFLYDVDAVSATDVWAVGEQSDSTNYQSLIEHWDGESWTIVGSPISATLHGVVAIASNDVWAVGYTASSTYVRSESRTLHWDGTSWTIVPSPNLTGYSTYLYAVDAGGPNDVWAVGLANSQSLTMHWDGTAWTIIPVPPPTGYALNGVAVVGPDDVWAVGKAGNTFIAHWNGITWTQVPSPNPGTYTNELNGVTAIAANDVWAVGTSANGPVDYHGLLMHWDGVSWQLSSAPGSPEESPDTYGIYLYGVAAAATDEVWAVGKDYLSSDTMSVILRWDGNSWTEASHPQPSRSINRLYGVAAVTPGEAWAVGNYWREGTSNYRALIQHYGPPCGSPTPTITGTPPAATSTRTATSTSVSAQTGTPISTSILSTSTSTTVASTATGTSVAATGTATAIGTATSCANVPINGSLTLNDPTQAGRLNTLLSASSCDDPRGCPGALDPLPRHYDAYTFVNTSSSGACFTVNVTAACLDEILIHSSTYLDSFDPQNLCQNYLADVGPGILTNSQYSFTVPAGARFVVVVNELAPNLLCPNYTLTVTGPACPVPSTPAPSSTPILPEITVTAIPTLETCQVQFSDVQPGDTFYSQIMCLACNGLMSGYSDSTFRPYNEVTRGQLAKIVSIASGFNETTGDQTFEDVPVGSTFHLYVERMASRGIVGGYPCGGTEVEPCGVDNKPYFRPNADANRGQISKIIATAAQLNGLLNTPAGQDDEGQMFEDVTPGNTYYEWVQMLASHGMIGGYQCGGEGEPCGPTNMPYFRTYNNANRGQASKIVANTYYPSCQTR